MGARAPRRATGEGSEQVARPGKGVRRQAGSRGDGGLELNEGNILLPAFSFGSGYENADWAGFAGAGLVYQVRTNSRVLWKTRE
jgi:hypothetical protein